MPLPVPGFDPHWLADLRARADVPPLQARVPLLAGQDVIGSVLPDFGGQIDLQNPDNGLEQLSKVERYGSGHVPGSGRKAAAWRITGPLTDSLDLLARALRDAGVGHVAQHWRNEALAVHSASGEHKGERLGEVERGAVRTLGITTSAVHMVGFAEDGRVWVQQRALSKANDPGLWDTLMGGMVSSKDTVQTALVRETWEEAGLHLDQLQAVQMGGRITVRRPTGEPDDDGVGYVIEDTDWFHCTVPDGVVPVNQDGEVEQFLLLAPDDLVARLQRHEFTLEAALILVAALEL